MKIAIIGAGGLVGSEFACSKRKGVFVVPLSRAECDVTNTKSIEAMLCKHRPDVVVNCAVMVGVDQCEQNPEQCAEINTGGVKNILHAVHATGQKITFVQISSSEVFGRVKEGQYKIGGYTEDDSPKPVSRYQKTKAAAEKALQAFIKRNPRALKRWYIARGGWLYGAGRKTFIDQFYAKLQEEGELEVVVNQWRSPTWTKHFIEGIFNLLQAKKKSGIYHVANETEYGEASTLDVIEEIALILGMKKVMATLKLISRDDIFTTPRAPSNVLRNTKLPPFPYWRDALHEYLQEYYR